MLNKITEMIGLSKRKKRLSSKELIDAIGISNQTLKHWRYGNYSNNDGEKSYYTEDESGVPSRKVTGGQYVYYTYSLAEVKKWVSKWKKSAKRTIVLEKIERAIQNGK